ncbi:MAG: hypothetical protein KC422_05035 [Trueperaceae bacterium]|nr:hypothetical protein [Trueperaceae bacterium]
MTNPKVISKNKMILFAFLALFAGAGVIAYALQFSALSYQFDCSRQANQCILARKMVIGGIKEDMIAIDQINKVEITLHSNQQSNVWVITDHQRLPLGTFRSYTSEANHLMNDLNSYIYDSSEESFSHHWSNH